MRIGQLFKMKRTDREMTLNEVARHSGIAPSYLLKIEKGEKTNISFEKVLSIAKVLNISMEELLRAYDYNNDIKLSAPFDILKYEGINSKIDILKKRLVTPKDFVSIVEDISKKFLQPSNYIVAIKSEDVICVEVSSFENAELHFLITGLERLEYSRIIRVQGLIENVNSISISDLMQIFIEENIYSSEEVQEYLDYKS